MTLEEIRRRLAGHDPEPAPTGPDVRNAAVAVILRAAAGQPPDVLFIRRAERPGDPWSGQMAFPGGHADATDADLVATAMRETVEEVGIDLGGHAELIAPLESHLAMPLGGRRMAVSPFVFALTGDPEPIPNHEVAEVVWSPLLPLLRGHVHTRFEWDHPQRGGAYPGYEVPGGHIVWGLTYRMLHSLFDRVEPGWRPPPDPGL